MGIGNLFKKAGTAIIDKSGIKDSEAYRKMSSEVQKVQDAVKNPGSVMGMLKDKVAAAGANANDASRTLLRSMSGEDVDEEETADAFDSVVSDFKGRIARERNPETARAANLLLSMIEGGGDDEDDEDEEYDEEAEREAAKRKALEEAAAKRAALDAAAAKAAAEEAARKAAEEKAAAEEAARKAAEAAAAKASEQEKLQSELPQLQAELAAKQEQLAALGTDAMAIMKKAKLSGEIKALTAKIEAAKG